MNSQTWIRLKYRLAERAQRNQYGDEYDTLQLSVLEGVEKVMRAARDEGILIITKRTHEKLREERDIARHRLEFEKRDAEHAREWAGRAHDEQRRLTDRLTKSYGIAKAQGVDLVEIEHEGEPCAWSIDGQRCTKDNIHNKRPGDYAHETEAGALWANNVSGSSESSTFSGPRPLKEAPAQGTTGKAARCGASTPSDAGDVARRCKRKTGHSDGHVY